MTRGKLTAALVLVVVVSFAIVLGADRFFGTHRARERLRAARASTAAARAGR